MRLIILAVGRLKSGAERELEARYLERARALGRSIGLTPLDLTELNESAARRADARMVEEAERLLTALPNNAFVIALDERGKAQTSEAFACEIGRIRDNGCGPLVFIIGGPDGLANKVRARANFILSFGSLTWPHQLVRVLIAEQIYRAMTILAGHPYHRFSRD